MLRSMKSVVGDMVEATDGTIGNVVDLYFDDIQWGVRYVVVDTSALLPGKKVLLSTAAILNAGSAILPVNLTKEQVKNSPDIDTAKPISRVHEEKLHYYYGWPVYWRASWAGTERAEHIGQQELQEQTHLRSIKEVTGYHIISENGEIGHVEDFIADYATWIMRYFAIDTANWRPSKKVLISPDWIDNIEWSIKKVFVDLTKQEINDSPEYNPNEPVNRAYEEKLYDYYGRPKYWMENVIGREAQK